ncbi:hypothetical protein RQP50_13970 [Paenibacillus sp. chi10]|uniref:Uncharacterized protein n=1 Tax=Paenibacillus suaedae TaxID=3077233 RepID=A0AAJ2N977_9BACL|nr:MULTISPECIES: hypothetical protein [unclassified Paenibacillus]MDT8977339.1 hypothetical protein [Paenibacillus sp. chi10]GAV11547.1 hypothetical protein PBN151_1476 [Paenibacillus sp. NAIST15-1]
MTIGIFVGACDKSDHVVALATFLTRLEKKVLIVDATTTRRIGTETGLFMQSQQPIMHWNGYDVLSGAISWDDMIQLLERHGSSVEGYDHIIIDTDRALFCNAEQWKQIDTRLLVQTMERFSLQKNREWLQAFQQQYDGDEELEFVPMILRSLMPEDEFAFMIEWYYSVFEHRWARECIAIEEDERNWTARMSDIQDGQLHASNYPRATKRAWRILTEHFTGKLTERAWKQCLRTPKKGRMKHVAL